MTDRPLRVAVLTISDRSSAGQRPDLSGPALAAEVEKFGWVCVQTAVVPDEISQIASILVNWADSGQSDLILTTGGTGFSPRDVTPEATRAVLHRETPGIAEAVRSRSLAVTPHAMLSRAVSGIRGKSLIINLPGSPKAAVESLGFIAAVLPHAVQLISEDPQSEQGHHFNL